MKKTIQILLIIILVAIIALLVVFVFNPFNLRTKLLGSIINGYLEDTIEDYAPLDQPVTEPDRPAPAESAPSASADKHPLLNEEQERALEGYGVDVSQLPASISPAMEACLIDKLGQERADEIVAGANPGAMDVFKARSCLGQ